jgi:predicted RNA binding protein YcfA (HicA-like mRNA interferase family)
MSKLPRITGKQAMSAFLKAGFSVDRVTASHWILKKPGHKFHLSVPIHSGKNWEPAF